VNSFWRQVSRGVHLGLDFGEGWEWGAEASIIMVRAERVEENHWSSWVVKGAVGGGGTRQFLSLSVRLGQSASGQRGLGLSLWRQGGRRESWIGVSSDPVKGRADGSHDQKVEKI